MNRIPEMLIKLVGGPANLSPSWRKFVFSRGDIIFNENDESKFLYFIESGLVGIIKTSFNGSDYILRIHGSNDFFGYRPYLTNKIHFASAMAIDETVLIQIPIDDASPILENKDFLKLLIKDLSEKMLLTERRFTSSLDKNVKARIAEALIFLTTRYPEHRWTKKEIAEFCGSTTSTVIRTLSEFQDNGFIDQSSKNLIILSSKELLNKYGVFDE